MGTHPIFESDFDCLTDLGMKLSSSLYSLIAVGSANQARWSGKSYRDNGVLKFKIESETTGNALKRIEDDEDFLLEWLAPHEGPNYQIGTDVIIMTEPEDLKYVKKTLAKTGASINDTNNLDEMIAARFTNQKKERQVPLIPLSPPRGTNDDSTSNDKITPGEY